MKIVVISSPTQVRSELDSVIKMFDEGLETFHLRKSKFSRKDMIEYLEKIPKHYRNRVVLHTHHSLAKKFKLKGIHLKKKHRKNKLKSFLRLFKYKFIYKGYTISTSFHSLSSISDASKFDYSILSPIFESISKKGYSPNFTHGAIKHELKINQGEIYALGGIDAHNAIEAKKMGFGGVVLLGVIWNTDNNPVEVFKSIRRVLDSDSKVVHKLNTDPVKNSL